MPVYPRNILIFRIGSLGDTLVALPAFWAIREHFPEAHSTLLCSRYHGKSYVLTQDVVQDIGVIDDFISYPTSDSWLLDKLLKSFNYLSLAVRLRRRHFDTLVYLAPTEKRYPRVERDRRFFELAGIRHFIGMRALRAGPDESLSSSAHAVPPVADQLLGRLAADGIPVPPPGSGKMDLSLNEQDEKKVMVWLKELPPDGGRLWLGIGPGSKMPAKVWFSERFIAVVRRLIDEYDLWPVVFGGPEDSAIGQRMINQWGRGYVAAGALGIRPAAVALKRCVLYLGNDTGTMHLATAVQTPCVAIFSARDEPGKWDPYGPRHRVLRTQIDCAGCMLVECKEQNMECLRRITVEQVTAACRELLLSRLAGLKAGAGAVVV